MKIHPRHDPVTKADIAIREAVAQAAKENGLNFAELVMILANIISGWSKFEIREERTP